MVRKNRKQKTDFKQLEVKLLAVDGDRGVEMPEPHLDILFERGQVFESAGSKRVKGKRNRCHGNAALHYMIQQHWGRGTCDIVTGYAMHGGVWRQHSWLWNGNDVLETTCNPEVYFGAILNAIE